MKTNKILKVMIIIVSIVLVILLAVLGFQVAANNFKTRFQENVVISGISVKGLTKLEAENKINSAMLEKLQNLNIKIKYKDKEWNYSSEDFKIDTNIHTIVNDAFRYSKISKNAQKKLNKIQKLGVNYDIAFNKIFIDFNEKVDEIKSEIEVPFIDSKVEFLPDSEEIFKITKSQNGLKVNTDKLYSEIEKQFKTTNNIVVELETYQVSPEISEDYYNGKLELLGEFSTDLSTSKGGRKHNVSLALEKFNGKVIQSNEEISFNEITGPHTAETGYQSAIIIQNGQYVEGIGGGICQASTTLYNALLLSGSQINEVHKHTLPVGYVEMSLDAMVNEGTSDLKFKNISENPIYIKSYVKGDRAYAKVYGEPLESGVTYKRSIELVRNIPHNGDKIIQDTKGEYSDKVTHKGEYFRLSYPKEGYEVKGYLEKYKDGEFISKELIRHEIYEPKQGILIEGTKESLSESQNTDVVVIPPQIEVETFSELVFNEVLED